MCVTTVVFVRVLVRESGNLWWEITSTTNKRTLGRDLFAPSVGIGFDGRGEYRARVRYYSQMIICRAEPRERPLLYSSVPSISHG